MKNLETAIFGGGCFWCTEAIFVKVKGIETVESGYAGGDMTNPSYHDVTEGTTGHAEVIKLEYDPKVISYIDLLDIFFHTHNPTTKDRQGNDAGTQYRSVIFYMNAEQKKLAEETIQKYTDEKTFPAPIVTEVVKYKQFFKAEDYHQNYFEKNSYQPYCQIVIEPKLKKFLEKYQDKLK
ncbi:MAG: peptide-methionine (S)-S-oxide reductase MsrA [Weeksellaceae bacterium]